MRNTILWTLSLAVLLLVSVTIYLTTRPVSGKHGYIINQAVFDGFKGKQTLEKKLSASQEMHKRALDSLETNNALVEAYNTTKQQYIDAEEQLSSKYTEDIWKEINQQVAAFGKEKGYDFIYGATGNGSLMYGSDSFNVTADLIEYINDKYEGKK